MRGLLERGESRPDWCRMAVDGGELLAAHALDSWCFDGPPGETPTVVTLLGHSDPAAATALLRDDLERCGATSLRVDLWLDGDAPAGLRRLREQQHGVLLAAGFTRRVDRVSLQWSGAPPSTAARTVTFEPVTDVPEEELVEIFAAVADGSVDQGMRTGRDDHGRHEEAVARLRAVRRRTYESAWFVVARDAAGGPVGYVQSAVVDGRAVLAEVGVVRPRRGRRLVDQLLAYGTAVLAAHGETHVRAHTDSANTAMRRAFARAGYAETGTRVVYRWVAGAEPSGTDAAP